jgi:hypothetical protein
MRARFAMTAAAATLGLASCGDDGPRDRVNDYLREVSTLQQGWAKSFDDANRAYVAFSKDELAPEHAVERLQAAERDIAAVREDVAELEPPAEARRLHSQVVRLYDRNVAFARETTLLAGYVPAAERALRPLDAVNAALRRRLADTDEIGAQARALRRFVLGLDRVLGGLRALEAPAVLDATHTDQVRRLERTRSLAARLDRALVDEDAKAVARLLGAFRRSVTLPARRRRLADQAITRYADRYRELSDMYADVRREEVRLDGSLD